MNKLSGVPQLAERPDEVHLGGLVLAEDHVTQQGNGTNAF